MNGLVIPATDQLDVQEEASRLLGQIELSSREPKQKFRGELLTLEVFCCPTVETGKFCAVLRFSSHREEARKLLEGLRVEVYGPSRTWKQILRSSQVILYRLEEGEYGLAAASTFRHRY